MPDKKSSHLGVGLLAGAILGVAAGLFLQSKDGKQMTKSLQRKALKLQTKLMQELQKLETLTQDKYTKLVDEMMKFYLKTKEIARQDVPQVRQFLLQKWSHIEQQLKALRK